MDDNCDIIYYNRTQLDSNFKITHKILDNSDSFMMDLFDIHPQSFYLFSKNSRKLLSFSSPDHSLEKAIDEAFDKIINVEGGNVHAIFRYEPQMLDVMNDLEAKYGAAYPKVKALPAFMRQLNEGELFIRHQSWAPDADLMRTYIQLRAICRGDDYHKADNIFFSHWGRLYLSYETVSYGILTEKKAIGEDDPSKRICRFCGCTGEDHFKSKAHAIPQSLGNELLICNEECDTCNNKFQESTEKHLFKLLEINRTLSNIRGKGSRNHHLEGLNFQIHPDDTTKEPVLYLMQDRIFNDQYKGEPTGKIHLYNNAKISYNGVYRALIKIAIDLMPTEKMPHFIRSGQWLHGDFQPSTLPPFCYGEHGEFFEQPIIDLFFRTKKSPVFSPYCTAVLHIFDSVFIYTVPFNDIDGERYLAKADLDQHYNFFKAQEYLYIQEWADYDSNNTELQTPLYKVPALGGDGYRMEFRDSSDPIFEIKRDK